MIDYIFYPKEHWDWRGVAQWPDLETTDEKNGGLPNFKYPSDHIMGIADLRLLKSKQRLTLGEAQSQVAGVRQYLDKEQWYRQRFDAVAKGIFIRNSKLKEDESDKYVTMLEKYQKNMKAAHQKHPDNIDAPEVWNLYSKCVKEYQKYQREDAAEERRKKEEEFRRNTEKLGTEEEHRVTKDEVITE